MQLLFGLSSTSASPLPVKCVCVCVSRTGGEARPGPRRLHLLARVRQHVVALGLVDQVAAGLRGLDQLLVVHHVQQVGRVDEGEAHHRQQVGQSLRRRRRSGWLKKPKAYITHIYLQTFRCITRE